MAPNHTNELVDVFAFYGLDVTIGHHGEITIADRSPLDQAAARVEQLRKLLDHPDDEVISALFEHPSPLTGSATQLVLDPDEVLDVVITLELALRSEHLLDDRDPDEMEDAVEELRFLFDAAAHRAVSHLGAGVRHAAAVLSA